jgi:hypothetical protein
MSRQVQLELTLDVEVEAKFTNGAWNVTDVGSVYIDGQSLDIGDDRLGDTLFNNPRICERLAELFEQQEP